MKLLPEVVAIPPAELSAYILKRAERIVRNTPGDTDSWDDPESYQMDAVELAHAVMRAMGPAPVVPKSNNWPLRDVVMADDAPTSGEHGQSRWLVTLICGHKKLTDQKLVAYPCGECHSHGSPKLF